jgi:hypothetical protein
LILSHGQEKDGIVSCYQDLKMLKVSKWSEWVIVV